MHIVTGGSGFFGQHLVRFLAQKGQGVKSIDILPFPEEIPGVVSIIADCRDKDAMKREISAGDIVIHNAALVPLAKDDKGFWEVNVEGTRAVLEAAAEAGVKKFVFISSSSVFGVPKTKEPITEETPFAPFEAYGTSKVAAEKICAEFSSKLDISIVRPRTIIGPGRMGILAFLFEWALHNRPVWILGDGSNAYQLISAKDLCEFVWRVCTQPCHGEHFNVGTTRFTTLREDIRTFLAGVDSRSSIKSVPGWLARLVLPILSALKLVPFVTYQYTVADRHIEFSMEKAKRILGWTPQESNAEMLIEACEYYRTHPTKQRGSLHSRAPKKGLLKALDWF
jgi:nucleoside-diphosphate-sugar epimerase